MYYIQRKDSRELETVDEFETRKEARAMLAEYRMSDPSANYYTSTRACKDWKDI
jgi:putative IMPACT (imprinted ancient) family translation regulator